MFDTNWEKKVPLTAASPILLRLSAVDELIETLSFWTNADMILESLIPLILDESFETQKPPSATSA